MLSSILQMLPLIIIIWCHQHLVRTDRFTFWVRLATGQIILYVHNGGWFIFLLVGAKLFRVLKWEFDHR